MIRQLTVNISVLFFSIFNLLIYSQTIDNIEVRGNSEFSKKDYIEWARISNQKFVPELLDSAKTRIIKNLQIYGYYNFSIDSLNANFSPDSQHVKLSIAVTEGEPTFINKIEIINSDSLTNQWMKENSELIINSPFVIPELEKNISEIVSELENSGYPFASIDVESLFFFYDSLNEQNSVDILLRLSENRPSTIDTIVIKGNKKTKDYVITRELRFAKNEQYSQRRIEKIQTNLNRLHFFNLVKEPKFYFNSRNKGVLQIEVEEKNTNSFDGLLGYIPSNNKDESGYFTGLVNISMRNLFGTGRGFAFKWSKLDKYSQELELKYLEPWIFGLPFNINLLIFQRQQDSTYVQRALNGNVEFLATESFSASLIFSNEYTIPTSPETSGFTVFNSVATNSGVNFKYDSRDDILVPTRGMFLLNAYKYIAKNINGPDEFITGSTNISPKQYKVELDLLLYKSFFTRHIPFVGLHIRALEGDDIEVSDMYRIGGNNTLRGYQENQFFGNRIIWGNFEYRYLIGKNSYTFLFTDIAYYKRNSIPINNITEFSATKIGYGAGITFKTGLGMLAVSYAIAKGDSFSNGKIHFGLIGEF